MGAIFSSSGLLRITTIDPLNCSNCFFLNLENRRLTVSRIVPRISEISSWVRVSLTCEARRLYVGLAHRKAEASQILRGRTGETENADLLVGGVAVTAQLFDDANGDLSRL